MREIICTKAIDESICREWEQAGIGLRVYPMIKTLPLPFHINIFETPAIWIFTSEKAVDSLKTLLKKYFLAIYQNKLLVAIAPKTADALAGMGYHVEIRSHNAMALAEEINIAFPPQKVLHFCGDKRRDELSERLTELGFTVMDKKVYQTVLTPQKLNWGDAEAALFFSPSAVESFFKANDWPEGKIAYAIGPTTAAALKQREVAAVYAAAEPNFSSMREAVLNIRVTNKELRMKK